MKLKIIITGGRLAPESQERLDAYLAAEGTEEFHRILILEATEAES